MPVTCCIQSCSSHSFNTVDCKFYLFPQIRMKTPRLKTLSEERHRKWLKAINRKKLNTKIARVCSKHFISGKSANLCDHLNPDWVPSLHLGYASKSNPKLAAGRYDRHLQRVAKSADGVPSLHLGNASKSNPKLAAGRYDRHLQRVAKSALKEKPIYIMEHSEFVSTLQTEEVIIKPEFVEEEYLQEYLDTINVQEHSHISVGTQTDLVEETSHESIGTQTDLVMKEVETVFSTLRKKELALERKEFEISELKREIVELKMGMDCFKDNDAKTKYFTGLPQYISLITIYKAIEESIPDCLRKGLNKFQVLVLTLLKLRLDLPFTLLGFMFGVSTQTASKKFYDCVVVLSSELSCFVSWPDKDDRAHYTTEDFKRVFGNRLAVTIECYEIPIEKSGPPVARAATYSSFKSAETIKYLIGAAPSGAIVYTSKAYGGRSSDKFISEKSDFLSFLQPGDIVLSDNGFLMEDTERHKGTELKMASFLQGKLQLDTFSVEESKHLSHLRVHLKTVIHTLRQRYLILTNTQPVARISKKTENNEIYMDKIVLTCCALVNLSQSVANSTLQNVD